MRRKTVIILVGVFAVGVLSGLIIPRWLKRGEVVPPTRFISRYLSLSESQREELTVLDQEFRIRLEETRSQLDVKRAELSELLGQPSSQREKVHEKLSEIAFLQGELQRETMSHFEKIRAILNPGQEEKFLSLIQRRLHPRGPWMHQRGPDR